MFPNEIWFRVVGYVWPEGLRAVYGVSRDLRAMVVERVKGLTEGEILVADVPMVATQAPVRFWILPDELDVLLERASWCNSLRIMERLLEDFRRMNQRGQHFYKWRFLVNATWVLEHEKWCRSMCKQGLIMIEFMPQREGHLREYRINGDWMCVEPGSRHARYPKRKRISYY